MTDQSAEPLAPARSQWWDVWDQFRSHRGALFGGFFFLGVIAFVLFGEWIWGIDPTATDIRARNTRHIFACFSLDWGAITGCFLNPAESGLKVTWETPPLAPTSWGATSLAG